MGNKEVKKTTAMMEMLERLKMLNRTYDDAGLRTAIDIATELLEKEKEQIIDSYWEGINNGMINDYSECKTFGDNNAKIGGGAELYYTSTYKQ